MLYLRIPLPVKSRERLKQVITVHRDKLEFYSANKPPLKQIKRNKYRIFINEMKNSLPVAVNN